MNPEEIKQFGLRAYTPGVKEDLIIFRWWAKLHREGLFEEVFDESAAPFGNFIQLFMNPRLLTYSQDEAGDIEFAFWFTPFALQKPTSFVSIWADKKLIGTRRLVKLTGIVHDVAFRFQTNLLAVVRLNKVAPFSKVGYNVIGTVPNFFPEGEGYQLVLTKEMFEQSKLHSIYRSLICQE